MTLCVCGGRDYEFVPEDYDILDALKMGFDIDTLVHGAARGADYYAELWAIRNNFDVIPFHADWEKHGRAAGPIRNQEMIDEGRIDLLVAFPGGKGTEDMVNRAKKANITVIRIEH